MELTKYGNLMKLIGKEKYFSIRKSIAFEAQKHGIKPTARKFHMSKNTVRLWLRRFQIEGNDGLIDRRNGPDQIPHKTSPSQEHKIIEYRLLASCYGARRLKYFFDLKPSIGAIHRIIKARGLTARRRRKHQKKNDLREVKAKYLSLEKIQMDIKYLTDIPPYWEQMQRMGLPRFQYTIRDVKSGMLFLGYGDEISIEKAATMLNHVLGKIAPCFPGKIRVQTDNGTEFSGTTRHYERNYFTQAVERHGATHQYIRPGHCNANADVESIHHTIEEEFYNLTQFSSREDFLKKAESYRHFYNLVRPNFSKKVKTPWQIAQEDHPENDFATLAEMVEVIDLEQEMSRATSGGQALPVLPEKVSAGYKYS
jgi:transposase InsO family protein